MKRLDKKYILVAIVIIIILVVIFVLQKSFALDFLSSGTSSLQVRYGEYESLPKNYVQLEKLNFNEASFSTTNPNIQIKNNVDFNNVGVLERLIVYYGSVSYGTKNKSTTEDAVTQENTVPGTFSLTFKNAASLYDGKKADLKITFSDWKFYVGKNTYNISGDAYVPIMIGNDNYLKFITGSPRKNLNAGTTGSAGATIKSKIKATASIVDSNTDNPISSKYEQMLFGFTDFDASDASIAGNKTLAQRYNGDFAEGVTLVSGFASPVVFAPRTSEDNIKNNLLQAKDYNGNMMIKGDGDLYQVKADSIYNKTGINITNYDDATYYSGFIVPVKPQGFSFYWHGSCSAVGAIIATNFGSISDVSVTATSGEGGTIEKPGVTSYNLNSMTTYDYTPAHGYKVKTLKVNGEDVGFSEEGGTYTFRKLYKTPLVEVNDDGTAGAPLGEDYTIDVRFEEKDKIKVKYVTDKNGSIDKTEENVIEKDSPLGIVDTPNTGYKLLSIKCDKPVTLSTGKIISKENPMTLEELKKIIVEEPLVCTVAHKKDNTKTYNCED